MKCEKYSEMISAYIDGELTENEKSELLGHIKTCADCGTRLEMMRLLKDELPNMSEDVPDGFKDSVMKKVRAQKHGKIISFISARPFTIAAAAVVLVVLGANGLLKFSPYQKSADEACEASEAGCDTCSAYPDLPAEEPSEEECEAPKFRSMSAAPQAASVPKQASETYEYSCDVQTKCNESKNVMPLYVYDGKYSALAVIKSEVLPDEWKSLEKAEVADHTAYKIPSSELDNFTESLSEPCLIYDEESFPDEFSSDCEFALIVLSE